jgi:DNA-binding winged helix-turn-helix (wHTH) protein
MSRGVEVVPVSDKPVYEKPPSQKKVRFDEFELDYGRFQLWRGQTAVKLEGLPLQLLMFLVDNDRQLVTREQIAAALWGNDVFVDVEQGINTAIRKIRMALEDDAAQPQYLQTVVGRGYRFVAATSSDGDAAAAAPGDGFVISPAELGRAIMTAAGLDPENPKGPSKVPGES